MALVRIHPTLGYLTVYLAAVGLERLALPEDSGLAFFWPAAGVAALWMLSGRTRGRVLLDGALVVLGTTVLDVLMGVDVVPAVLLGLANASVGATFRRTSSLLEGRPFWGQLPRRLAGPRDLWGLGIASTAAALISAVPGVLAVLAESGSLTWDTPAGWVARTACSAFIVVAAVLGLLTTLLRAHARRGWSAIMTPAPRRFWGVELVAVGTISLGSAGVVFGSTQARPIAFVMIVASTWIGSRFSPAVGGLYTIVLGTMAALCTQSGRGPFQPIGDPTTQSIIVQVYVLVTAVIVLLLSLGASERAALLARVVESEARATSRADLVDAVTTVMNDGLVVVDANGSVLLSNPAAEALAGIGEDVPRVGTPQEHGFVRPDGTAPAAEDLPRSRALRGEFVSPTDLLRIDPQTGQQTMLSVSAMPLHQADPEAPAVAVLVMRDVTKSRAQSRELQNFAGVVAHDLKTPLTGVVSWAEILEEQLDDAGIAPEHPLRASLQRISGSADRMADLISDLLNFTQTQNAELTLEPVSLDEMVDQIARDLRGTHHQEIPLVEHGLLGHVMADRILVRQLFTNVIGNAVKYVAPGVVPHIVIGSAPIDDMLEIWVSDNGIGINDLDLGRVFDTFFRAASSTQDYPGTGLGLAICARMVERHGGRISARKGLDGQGTTMLFTLPVYVPGPLTDEVDAELFSATS
jgi:signal transduction histidine kinase